MPRTPWRRLAVAVVAVLAVAVGVAFVVYEGVRRYRPPLDGGEAYGIDVSRYQGTIDWEAVAGDGIDYAYIKATEGETWVDPEFARSWEASGEAGVRRGAYHFFSLCSRGEGQLANVLATVPVEAGALPPAVDLEFGACTERPVPAVVEADLEVLLTGLAEAYGHEPVLYVLPTFAARYPFLDDLPHDRWERRILRTPEREHAVWQVSNVARIEGIGGGVDLNVWRAPLP